MATVFRRANSPYWQTAYLDGAGRRFYKSTKQTRKSDAVATASKMEQNARRTASAEGDETRRRIFSIVEEASNQALRGTLNEVTARQLIGRILEETTGAPLNNPSVKEWLELWLEGKRKSRSHSTSLRYDAVVRQFLEHLPRQRSDAPIGSIVPSEIQSFYKAIIDSGRTEATANGAIKTLRAAFNVARRQGIVLTNSAEAIELSTPKATEKDVFTPEQVADLIEVAEPEWKVLIALGFYTGGRLGDLVSLRWRAVDFDRNTITFAQQKTGRSIEIPIHPTLQARLEGMLSREEGERLFPTLSERKIPGNSGLSQTFRQIMADAGVVGVTTKKEGESGRNRSSLSFHSLRHSFNSAMANAGVSQELRQKLTGHASKAINDRYTHTELATLTTAVKQVPKI